MTWADLAVVATLVVLWTVVSGPAERMGITSPMVFTLGGLALGADQTFHISLSATTIRTTVAQVTRGQLVSIAGAVNAPDLGGANTYLVNGAALTSRNLTYSPSWRRPRSVEHR